MKIITFARYQWMDGNYRKIEEAAVEYDGPLALADRKTSSQIAQQGIANSAQNQTNAQNSLGSANTALKNYSSNLDNFMKFGRDTYGQGGEFAADQNAISSGAAAAGTKSIAGDLALNKLRTGQNSASYAPTLASARGNAEQNLTQNLAGADATRLQNLTNINQQGVQMSALPAQIQAQLYGTSLGGANSALGTGEQASAASPSFTDMLPGLLGPAIGAAGNVGAAAVKACWIAAAVFDEDFATGEKTGLVRQWLWNTWVQHWYARPLLRLYAKFGKRAARSPLIVRLLNPLFQRALREAQNA